MSPALEKLGPEKMTSRVAAGTQISEWDPFLIRPQQSLAFMDT